MQAVILAGGLGTRLAEETSLRPKPMVEVGGRPILWHIMKIYSAHGINDFIICCGYRGDFIKEYFANYLLHTADVTIDLRKNEVDVHHTNAEDWRVTMIDTGADTGTAGRLRRVKDYLNDETFAFTYGDGVANIDITRELEFHRSQKTLATLAAVQPPGRFGAFKLSENTGHITSFREKPVGDGAWINGRQLSTTSLTMHFFGSSRHLKNWQKIINCRLTNITGFGMPWIHCATNKC